MAENKSAAVNEVVCALQALNEEELKVSQLLTLHPRRRDLEMVFFGSHLRVDSSVIICSATTAIVKVWQIFASEAEKLL